MHIIASQTLSNPEVSFFHKDIHRFSINAEENTFIIQQYALSADIDK